MIDIVAVDDHPPILNGLKNQISRQKDMRLVGTAIHGSMLIDLVRKHQPDVAIVDLGMRTGTFNPVACTQVIKKEFPNTRVLILTNYDDAVWVYALLNAGVSGYMLKSDDFSEETPRAIRALYKGGEFFSPPIAALLHRKEEPIELTNREKFILSFLDKGELTYQIGDRLGISEKRVRNMLVTICDKLDVGRNSGLSPRIAAINKAYELGLLPGRTWNANLVECYDDACP